MADTELTAPISEIEATTIRRIGQRFMPLLLIAYSIAYLDRVNVGFAALTANKDLGLSPMVYGWGAGIFFVGYFLFEFPSNLILERVGARLWIARIMLSWGVVSAGMALVTGPYSFYTVRFLLGLAEAGFFPGVILYLTYWFPRRYRARYIGLFMVGSMIATMFGAPVSGLLLGLDGFLGVKGWQWLYILEALPAIILGVAVLVWLTDTPDKAHWLTEEQRAWLKNALAQEAVPRRHAHQQGFFATMGDARVLFYALVFFNVTAPSYGLILWLPQIVKGFGLTNAETGFVAAIPYVFGTIAMVMWGRRSDNRTERRWHAALGAFLGAAGLGTCVLTTSPTLQMVGISTAAAGIYGLKGPWLSMVSESFSGAEAAGAIAMVSALGNLSGFLPPYAVGWIKDVTGSYGLGLLFLAVLSLLGGVQLLTRDWFERRMAGRERVSEGFVFR
jgi:ACS family tartrate transporter-like MFS transporter